MNPRKSRAQRVQNLCVDPCPHLKRPGIFFGQSKMGKWLGVSLALTLSAQAAEIIWEGGRGNGFNVRWTNPTAWLSENVPGSSDIAVFSGTSIDEARVWSAVQIAGLVMDRDVAAQIIISRDGSLTVLGTTTVTQNASISGGSFSTGDLNISSGTVLDLTGLETPAVISGKLTGGGQIAGNVTISGVHSPGGQFGTTYSSVVGNQTARNLSYAAGSIFEWDLTSNSDVAGFDRVIGNGTLDLGEGVTFRLVAGDAVDLSNGFWRAAHQWEIFSGFTSVSGEFDTVEVVDVTGESLTDSLQGNFQLSGTSLSWSPLAVNSVPEPAVAQWTVMLAAAIFRRRRQG
jgi:hypothetical protein